MQNPHLIYALIRSHKRFEDLSTFTLAGGVAAVRRARLEKRAAAAATADDGPSEKAMGKRRETSEDRERVPEPEGDDEGEHEVFVGKSGFVPSEGWVRFFFGHLHCWLLLTRFCRSGVVLARRVCPVQAPAPPHR